MQNCLMAYPDYTLSASLSSSGSWSSSFPLNNLKDKTRRLPARSSSAAAANTQWDVDLGENKVIRFVGEFNHNATIDATIRHRFYTGAGHTGLVADTGALPFYPSYYPHGVLEWEDPRFWDMKMTAAEIVAYDPKPDFWHALPAAISARYVWVTVEGQATTHGDYFELGRCFIAPAWQPSRNIWYGSSAGWASATEFQRSLGGQDFFNVRDGRRVLAVNFGRLSFAEGMVYLWDAQRRLDVHGEMFFVVDPDHALLLYKQLSFLCRMKELNPLEFFHLDATKGAKQLEEVL